MDLANLLLDTGQNRAAVACLKRLVQGEPKSISGWQNLAVAQFMVGRHQDGIASCHEALRLNSRNAVAKFNLALAYTDLRRYDDGAEMGAGRPEDRSARCGPPATHEVAHPAVVRCGFADISSAVSARVDARP